MIRDRGRIKWASIFIPEHKKMLAQAYEADNDIKKPELEEDKLMELNERLAEAIENDRAIKVSYFENKRIHEAIGRVAKMDHVYGNLSLFLGDRIMQLHLYTVLEIEFV